ncbi:DUF1772 domain-containing protein [Sphingosinicella sp. CPCC 101087]|uniref:anthrone oxygenase family protein n=1 Tax=Sphingosinicella sp. CPCC 101087 TaxID=2497754 RepID=UPI00101B8B06|nr:anthrone oxygenase family protein [Sphingosinicella sp. CPCC 101087]
MSDLILSILLWASAIGCAMMAGLYFAFSVFIMTALGRLGPEKGAATMQSINRVILKSAFMPLFLGTTLAALVLAGWALADWGAAAAAAMLGGGLIYVLGMFGVTMFFNVPLNNALDGVDPASPEAAAVWTRYLKVWTAWNHVRTAACTASSILFVASLLDF